MPSGPRSRRRTSLLVAVPVAVLTVAAGTWVALDGPGSPAGAGATPTAGVSPSAGPVGSPSASAVDPTASPSDPAPAAPTDGGPSPSAPAAVPSSAADPPPAPSAEPTVQAEPEEPVPVAAGVELTVVGLERVAGEAAGPGERAGPAVRVTVRVTNGGPAPLDLASAVVNAYVGPELVPASGLSGPGAQPFPPSAAPGGSADGVFVFLLPEGVGGAVRTEVYSVPGAPVLVVDAPLPAA
ncbi:hypothetical protein [Cellulomonas endophytica]|uniref:hypothetical protein n=1 Tax=Cellulomonas endophytica TaxID=2494735 RepID=UPI0010139529|nr:hypothetical protein [Cellulomonas endophytica]